MLVWTKVSVQMIEGWASWCKSMGQDELRLVYVDED
jgi:hypothetical protein